MKKLFSIVAAGLLIIGATSCKKCYECKKDTITGTTDETVCDYPGEASDRAEALEAQGYSCTAKN